MKPVVYYLFISLLILGSCTSKKEDQFAVGQYPQTPKADSTNTYFGTEVKDPYQWMEDDNSPEVAKWVKEENDVTFNYLNHIPFRAQLEDRLKTLLDYERVYAPRKHGDYYYFYKNDGLQNQNILYRKKSLDDQDAEVFLNPNEFSEDGTISLAGTSFSKDGSLMTFMISDGGSDWRKAITLNTTTKEMVGDTLRDLKFTGISWRGDEGFYYSRYPRPKSVEALTAANQNHKVYFHQLGTPQSQDALIFGGPGQERRTAFAYLTEDEHFLIIAASMGTSGNELYARDLSKPNAPLVTLVDNFDNDHRVIASDGDKLLIETNYKAPNKRIVSATLDAPHPDQWVDVIPEKENVLSANTGGGKIFAEYLVDAYSSVIQYDYQGHLEREIKLPGIGSVSGFGGREEDQELFYSYTSFTYPTSVFRYDIGTGESTVYEQPKVDFNPEEYETQQVFYNSKDGTRIPMFIVYKKGMKKDGKNPTYLYAYGGFDISLTPGFSASRILWLENGGIYAQPSLRGGGEYGEEWHKAGTLMQKQNVFDDFIAAAEYLIKENYTSSDYLAVAGGSNGGLLIGATMTQRPHLMKVALPAVGVMDMLRYHKFTIGKAWASDYGTSEDSKEMFQYLYGYSPYHNLKPGTEYPATLVTTADHDDRVVPAHSFKFAARLQEDQKGDNPVLIRIETRAGHGAGTPISKVIEQQADKYAFTWYNMGYVPPMVKKEQ